MGQQACCTGLGKEQQVEEHIGVKGCCQSRCQSASNDECRPPTPKASEITPDFTPHAVGLLLSCFERLAP
eukprot:6473565-Amphidinium_carterae.1